MVARVTTVAFVGVEARRVDVQVQVAPGMPGFSIVGLPDKAVAESRERVREARTRQSRRYAELGSEALTNASCPSRMLEDVARPDAAGQTLLRDAAERLKLSARGYHRVLRVARTLADLDEAGDVGRAYLAEAIGYRAAGSALLAAA
jgi:magnesium chelatase family protein